MISSLHGVVADARSDSVDVIVGGAVGFTVAVAAGVARSARVGEAIVLHTSLQVREDALTLFGFATREEVALFTLLTSVSGVGPKSGLGILSQMSPAEVAQAVADEDDAPFRRVSGVGPKTAKLIVVQLAGKLLVAERAVPRAAGAPAGVGVPLQVTAALVGLGWPERTAAETVERVTESSTDETVAGLLRLALAELGPARRTGADV